MRSSFKRQSSAYDPWPGFVDVLSTLLMVVVFVLMVFVIAQFFLSQAFTQKDEALVTAQHQLEELSNLLALEKQSGEQVQEQLHQAVLREQGLINTQQSLEKQLKGLSEQGSNQTQVIKALQESLARINQEKNDSHNQVSSLQQQLAQKQIDTATAQQEIVRLSQEITILKSLRDDLTYKLSSAERQLKSSQQTSDQANLQIMILNQQILELRQQLGRVEAALNIAETKTQSQQSQIVNLSERLNLALLNKVEDLNQYRSEFFGKLRQILGARDDIKIVKDRFILQSEVLFRSASAQIEPEGERELAKLAATLQEIMRTIPPEIDWFLRIDGHTDKRALRSGPYQSNWELSSARAIAVLKFLIQQGIPPERMAATGFGEFSPIDPGNDEEAYRHNRRIELKLDQR